VLNRSFRFQAKVLVRLSPFIVMLGVGLALLSAPVVEAQSGSKVYRIGLLGSSPPTSGSSHLWEAFLQAMRERGYVDGQTILIEGRYSEGHDDRLPGLAAELVRLKVDVIVAGATQPAEAAKRATATIPIVMPNHSDPVATGIVASLSRPGGNATGLSIQNPELTGKRLALLKEAVSKASHVAVLWSPTHNAHPRMLSDARMAARELGIRVLQLSARGAADFAGAFSAMRTERVDALLVLGDLNFWRDRVQIAALAAKNRLPTMFAQREHVEAGGLMHYGPDLRDSYRRAADYVDKILRGAKPGDLPIAQPTKFELSINLKTARVLGLNLPASLLIQADEVIQ
jgi:putative tryptophan/tyrosine transport system substrate-binding protein